MSPSIRKEHNSRSPYKRISFDYSQVFLAVVPVPPTTPLTVPISSAVLSEKDVDNARWNSFTVDGTLVQESTPAPEQAGDPRTADKEGYDNS